VDLNPDVNSCLAKCVRGICEISPDPNAFRSGLSAITSYKSAVTGLWNSDKPYVVYSPPKQNGETNVVVSFQALRADRTKNGAATSFTLPTPILSVSLLAATIKNNKIGLLLHGTKDVGSTTPVYSLEFAETDFLGVALTPKTLSENTVGTNRPEDGRVLFLASTIPSNYAMLKFGGTPASWKGYAGEPVTASVTNESLSNSPVDLDPSVVLFGNTIFVTGRNCPYSDGSCKKHLNIQRYAVGELSAIASNSQLSVNPYDGLAPNVRTFSPAMAVVDNSLAVFWNENGPSGLELVRDRLKESGEYLSSARVTTATNLYPKAVAAFKGGGGVLIASRANASAANYYDLIAQRFDASLNLIGESAIITEQQLGEPMNVEARVDSTATRVLVTFRQDDSAEYALFHAGLCQ
jgi:hypothetical protein